MLFSTKFKMETREQGAPRVTAGTLPSAGVTFSFFWKTQGEQGRPGRPAYGGQVLSGGFKVCSSGGEGSVELYTRDDSMTWEATFSPPGERARRGPGSPGEACGEGAGLPAGARGPAASWLGAPFLAAWSGRLPGGGEEVASMGSPD